MRLFSPIVMTNLQTKVLINSVLAFIAVCVITAIVAIFANDRLLRNLGDQWTEHYIGSKVAETKDAIAKARKENNPETLTTLLKKSEWDQIQLGDRAYSQKRKILKTLCLLLRSKKDYPTLAYWAQYWRDLSDRDLDARAFWHEAARFTSSNKDIGIAGLLRNYNDFPENQLLRIFLIQAYEEREDDKAISHIIRKAAGAYIGNVVSNWKVYWSTIEAPSFAESRSKGLNFTINDDGTSSLDLELPSKTTFIRIDLPKYQSLKLQSLQLEFENGTRDIELTELQLNDIKLIENTLLTTRQSDPYFVLPENTGSPKYKLKKLRFNLDIVVDDYELPIADALP